MPRKSTGVYPLDWKQIATAVKDAAGWRCVRCGAPHVNRAGYTLAAPSVVHIGTRLPGSRPVRIAGVTEPPPKRFAESTTVRARLGRLRAAHRCALRQEASEPSVYLHVASAAERHHVLGTIIAGVSVPVMTVRGWFAALFAGTQDVGALCSLSKEPADA